MTPSAFPSYLVEELRAICDEHPLRRKLLLMPTQHAGQSLIETLVHIDTDVVGLEATTLQ